MRVTRILTTSVTAAALAFSMLASTIPANAATAGFHAAWVAQSAYATAAPGDVVQMSAVYQNTGNNPWIKGQLGTSQANFSTAAPRGNTTLNDAGWSAGQNWLAPNRYAAQANDLVVTGQLGSWAWSVKVPAATPAGVTTVYGIPVVDGVTYMEDYGFFLNVTVGAPGAAPVLTTLTPNTGSSSGGTSVVVAGTGFICTPTLPTVNFGTTAGTVTSCGATSLTVTSPAGAVGTASVTVNNSGGAASNGLDYIYADTTKPVFNSITAAGRSITLTFSETVCRIGAFSAGDTTVTVNGVANVVTATSSTACNGTFDNGTLTFDVTVTTPFINGDTVDLTLTAAGGLNLRDKAGNTPNAQTREAIATGDTTKPSISTAVSNANGTDLKLTYTEAVLCNNLGWAQFSATPTGGAATTATGILCIAVQPGSTTVTVTFPAATFASGVGGSVTYTAGLAADRPVDRVGNEATTPQTLAYTSFSADATKPLSQDIRIKTSAGFAGLLDTLDVFTIAYNEVVATPAAGSKIRLTDADGTVADVICGTNATCVVSLASTTIGGTAYPTGQVITVTMTADPTIVTAGTAAGLAIPSTVVDSAGFTDTAGNIWDIANSPDKTLN